MKKLILTTGLLTLSLTILTAQTTSKIRYFKDENFKKEVTKGKANYSETITTNADSSITREEINISQNKVISSQTNKGIEPVGIWKIRTGSGVKDVDYNFKLVYSDSICHDSTGIQINDFFENNESIGYIAPKISTGETNIYEFFAMNSYYPPNAAENNTTGTVYLKFRITYDGRIENISITKGVSIDLDKETVRVLKLLKFSSPPYIKGKPVSLCVTFSLKYNLE